jgi:hypothetical protein
MAEAAGRTVAYNCRHMGVIETLDDAENRLMRERTAEAARVFNATTGEGTC